MAAWVIRLCNSLDMSSITPPRFAVIIGLLLTQKHFIINNNLITLVTHFVTNTLGCVKCIIH